MALFSDVNDASLQESMTEETSLTHRIDDKNLVIKVKNHMMKVLNLYLYKMLKMPFNN